jgi:uncharacterized protein (DUF2336 family)
MDNFATLMSDLEAAIQSQVPEARAAMLRRTADLFVGNVNYYAPQHVAMFDDVIGRLAQGLESKVLAELSRRLAPVAKAPPGVVKSLGTHDDPEVAAPVLAQSVQLADDELVEIVKTKSQGHLLAISTRSTLDQAVTDALVERGDQQVVRSLAGNSGARFSEAGFGGLVERSQGDDVLAEAVGLRRDLPQHQFAKLFSAATAAVQQRLATGNPHLAADIGKILARIAADTHDACAEQACDFTTARISIEALHKTKRLGEKEVLAFASKGRFEETVVALATLCGVPIEVAERAFFNKLTEPVLILAKAAGLSWDTTRCMLRHCAGWKMMEQDARDGVHLDFEKLQVATAQRVIRFYKIRQGATSQLAAQQN